MPGRLSHAHGRTKPTNFKKDMSYVNYHFSLMSSLGANLTGNWKVRGGKFYLQGCALEAPRSQFCLSGTGKTYLHINVRAEHPRFYG